MLFTLSIMIENFINRLKLHFLKDKELHLVIHDLVGFYPGNIEFYKLALMHKSVMHRNEKGKPVNNERLEFLGDAILDAVVGDIVYNHFPGKREGFLTNTRSKLVQRETLNKVAKEMGLNKLILSNGRSVSHNSYMGGNAFEALVGAIYLDKGYDACMKFMKERILKHMINIDRMAFKEVNFKSKLIEWSQKNKINLEYRQLGQEKDEDGNFTFNFITILEGIEGCQAKGYSKKESQQTASKLTLEKLKGDVKFLDSIFAAKAQRTSMEETPVSIVPDIHAGEAEGERLAVTDEAEEQLSPLAHRSISLVSFQEETSDENDTDIDFDLSDITAKAPSREAIIAAAEEAAFSEESE